MIRIFGRPRPLIFRYGIGNLTRPGRQIMTVVLSIGIGVLILLTLLQVEKNLLANLQQNIPEDAPSLFFIDLQPDQKEPFETIMAKWDLKKPVELTPLVRSRLFDLNGKKVSEIQTEERPDGWYFTREYVLTYQRDLPKHNTIRKGDWWEGRNPDGAVARISVEAEAARHLGIGIGSKVTFDIQGVPIQGEITSIRDVDWGSLSTNFFFIFEPGALEAARRLPMWRPQRPVRRSIFRSRTPSSAPFRMSPSSICGRSWRRSPESSERSPGRSGSWPFSVLPSG
ncbi:MAG: hypothetical protein MPW15_18285 [Candidatus Manganitrophus sp.]|nr:hypothetical protein [Candidatus Manganitrophus sp.]